VTGGFWGWKLLSELIYQHDGCWFGPKVWHVPKRIWEEDRQEILAIFATMGLTFGQDISGCVLDCCARTNQKDHAPGDLCQSPY